MDTTVRLMTFRLCLIHEIDWKCMDQKKTSVDPLWVLVINTLTFNRVNNNLIIDRQFI